VDIGWNFDKEGQFRRDRVAHLCDAEQYGRMKIVAGSSRIPHDLAKISGRAVKVFKCRCSYRPGYVRNAE
jgi:hypothetical protein